MDPKDWQVGDVVRRKTPYRVTATPYGELCRVKKVVPPIDAGGEIIILVVGNRTTGNPASRVEKHYEWVSRGDTV